MKKFQLNTLKDLVGQELHISSVNNEEFSCHGEISLINDDLLLTTYSTTSGISCLYDAVDIKANCIFKGNNLSEKKDYSLFFKNAKGIRTGNKAKFICKDIIVKEGYKANIKKEINLIKLYIKDLDEFIRVTNNIKEHSFKLHNAEHISEIQNIEPIDIGEIKKIKNNINLSFYLNFCFDWCSGGTDIGYYHYTEQTQITPYVRMKFSENISIDDAKDLVYEFIVLYSILTGKNEAFNSIELNNISNDEAEFWSRPQRLFSNLFKMNEGEEFSKYSVFNKYSLFPLGRNMSPELKATYIYGIPYNLFKNDGELNYELSNDVFYKFFNNAKIENYKLFYNSRFANKYQKFTTLFTCLEVMLNTHRGEKISKYFDNNTDIQNFINSIDDKILCKKQSQKGDNKNYINFIIDNRNHIIHGRIHEVTKLQVCTDILELIVYYLILSNIGIAKEELTRLGSYIDFNKIRNNLNYRGIERNYSFYEATS